MRRIKPADEFDRTSVTEGLKYLRLARGFFKQASCPQAVKAIRIALKSAEGAQRHMRHRLQRSSKP